MTTESESVTQSSLITDKITGNMFFIRALINFDRKRSIGRTVYYTVRFFLPKQARAEIFSF
jgi:hypothetical protein